MEESEVSNNWLVVEGSSDKLFIERLKEEINVNFDVTEPICNISECQCLDGIDNLENKLKNIKRAIKKQQLKKIGILIDADNLGIEKRVEFINQAIKCIDENLYILKPNTWYKSSLLDVEISCHILNINNQGYLETFLKKIASKPPVSANCLHSWQTCLKNQGKELKLVDFDKLWREVYIKYDCYSKKEIERDAKNCNFKNSLKRDFWNFSDPVLNDLKNYLSSFN